MGVMVLILAEGQIRLYLDQSRSFLGNLDDVNGF